jgi:hypothetical protein
VRLCVSSKKSNEISHHALWRGVVMVSDSIFVLDHLAVQLINQVIDGGIKVLVRAFCKQVVAFDMDVAFGALPFFFLFLFFDGEQHFHIHHLVKMPGDSVQFARYVAPEGGRHFEVMATDRQIHKKSSRCFVCQTSTAKNMGWAEATMRPPTAESKQAVFNPMI